jgi:hypothetical protein
MEPLYKILQDKELFSSACCIEIVETKVNKWIGFWNCSHSEVFVMFLLDFRIVLTLWYILCFSQILELLRHCGIFCASVRFYNCYDIVVYFVFLSNFRIVTTLWNILCFSQIL